MRDLPEIAQRRCKGELENFVGIMILLSTLYTYMSSLYRRLDALEGKNGRRASSWGGEEEGRGNGEG